jgi:septal ring factor EnvC (AmiA/AmiB activator)
LEKAVQLEQLRKLERQYGELAEHLQSLKGDIRQKEEKLQELRGQIAAKQREIQIQQRSLEGLIKSAYAIGDQEGLKLILNQRDPGLSGRILVYHDYIRKARLQKLENIMEDFTSLQQFESQKDAESRLLQTAMDKKQLEVEKLQALKSQRETLLSKLENEYESKTEQMQKLRHDEKKLSALVASLQKTDDNGSDDQPRSAVIIEPQPQPQPQKPKVETDSSFREPVAKEQKDDIENGSNQLFAEVQGQLPWPVQGEISERFGSRRFETSWDGAVISAREGADIHAVAPGRVVFADWLRGYGLMVIVDHGKGYMSLYGFNQSLHKNVGERVRVGEKLASVGRSGGRSEASLYFGIRKNGKPVDPEQWCKKPARN